MKKVKLNTTRLQLVKDKIGSLTKDDMHSLNGGTGATPCLPTYANCAPGTGIYTVCGCTGGCTSGCTQTTPCGPDTVTQCPSKPGSGC